MARLRTLLLAGIALAASAGAPAPVHAQDERPRLEQGGPPESFRRFVRDLEPAERRAVMRRMRRMGPEARQRFFEGWEKLSEAERAERRERWRQEFRARATDEAGDAA